MERWCVQVMNEEVMNLFSNNMTQKLGKKIDLKWDIDRKGVVCGWCKLSDPEDIYLVAELVADLGGRVMTISPLNKPVNDKPSHVVINYHFYFGGINCTVCITLKDSDKTVKSITPVLKSADWHEREMQELYNVKPQGHPNSKRLFLDENIHMTDRTMIPLSEALNGASTNTLWEKIMKSDRKEAHNGEL